MAITEVKENKKEYIDLLLLADEGGGILEIKNIATVPEHQGKGYAKALIDFLSKKYADKYSVLQVGTGESPLTLPFYEKCGFAVSHRVENFFMDNYDHSIIEGAFSSRI